MKTLLAALALALVTGSTALAETQPAPVDLTACRFSVYAPDAFNGARQGTYLRTLWVTFKNTGDVPIAAITFDAVKLGEHLVVTDVGKFSPGVTVTHQLQGYSTGLLQLGPGPDTCTVSATRYANGTTRTY